MEDDTALARIEGDGWKIITALSRLRGEGGR